MVMSSTLVANESLKNIYDNKIKDNQDKVYNKYRISLTIEEQKKYDELYYIVKYQMNKLVKINADNLYYDDYLTAASYGLIKGITTFSTTKGKKIDSYVTTCIRNQIYLYFRSIKKHLGLVSLNTPVVQDNRSEETNISLLDCLVDTDVNIEENFEENQTTEELINIILNTLDFNETFTALLIIAGKTKSYVASEFNVLQSYISKLFPKVIKKVKSTYCNELKKVDTNKYHLSISYNYYTLYMTSEDFTFLTKNLSFIASKYNYDISNISINTKNQTIIVPKFTESIIFLTFILKEIALNHMTNLSNYILSLEPKKCFLKAEIKEKFSNLNSWIVTQTLSTLQNSNYLGRDKNYYFVIPNNSLNSAIHFDNFTVLTDN